jgi:hypothetical protein
MKLSTALCLSCFFLSSLLIAKRPHHKPKISGKHSIATQKNNSKVCVRGCQNFGFFAEFLWVLNHLEWCNKNKLTPVVYWDSKFAYYSPTGFNGTLNAWEYFFEPVSSESFKSVYTIHRKEVYHRGFTTIWWYIQCIDSIPLLPLNEQRSCRHITEHAYGREYDYQRSGMYPVPFGNKHIYDKGFRYYVKETILDRYVKVKPAVQNKVEEFWTSHIKGKKTIGIHLRGKFLSNEAPRVPDEIIFAEANKYAAQGYQFLVASDQKPLVEKAIKELHGPVITYDCYRAQSTTSPFKPQQLMPQQAEDVLVEALLLSRCDHLIHTLSQVSTAVLYFNPELSHTLLY